MALWPNGRHMTRSTYKGLGVAPGLDASIKANGDRMNRFVNPSFVRTASTPHGYDMKSYVPPYRAGGMSTLRSIATVGEGTSNLLAGGPMDGTAGVASLTGDNGGLSMIVSLAANTAVATITGDSMVLKLTIGLDGNGTWTLTGTPNLSMTVPIEGTGGFTMTGTSDLRGNLSMAGEWTPFTALSPEGLAAAVWGAVAAANNDTGTMGQKLNSAASGGVDLNALAVAVWEYATRTLTSGGGATAVEVADAVRVELATELAQLTKVSKIHGVGVPLVVTATSRVAGDLSQTISTVSGTTTVSAA